MAGRLSGTGQRHIRTYYKEFQPADRTADETTPLFAVKAGQRVLAVAVMPLIAAASATNSTIEIGDGVDPDGYVIATTNYDPEASVVGTLIDGTGAYFGGNLGHLYLVDDTVDAVYTNATEGAVNPKIGVYLTLLA